MFDIGWTEMLVIAVIMIVVVGPKDLPRMLRTFGQTTKKLRGMAGDFQKQFNEALKEAELDDVKNSVDALRGLNPANQIKKQLNPFEKAAADVRSGLDSAMKPKASEPLKTGATAVPGAAATPAEAAKPQNFPAMDDPAVAKPATAAGAATATSATAAGVTAKPASAKAAANPAPAKAAPGRATKAARPAPAKPAATKPAPARPAAKPAKAATPNKKPAGPAK